MSVKKNKKKSNKKQKKEWVWWKKFKAKWKSVLIILFLIALVSLIIVSPLNRAHDTFLGYLKIFISWPFIILILGLILLFKFSGPISERIRTSTIKTRNFEIAVQPEMETKKIEEKELKDIKMTDMTNREKKIVEAVILVAKFERMLRYMYRSQFLLLHLLVSSDKGLNKALVESQIYKGEYLKLGGNPSYLFDAYLGWLQNSGLVTQDKINSEAYIKLTEEGKRFLEYVKRMNYSPWELLAGP